MEEQLNGKGDIGSMTVKDLFFKYVRFIPLFVFCVALALFIAYIYLRYAEPVYAASGTLMVKNEAPVRGNDEFEKLFMPSGTQNVQSEIEILRSRPLMERVVRALNLQVTYKAVGKIKTPNIYKESPFTFQTFELTDSTNSFVLNIKFSNDNEFTVNDGEQKFTFGQLVKNKNGVFRLNRSPGISVGKEYIVEWDPVYTAAGRYASAIQVTPKSVGTGILNIGMEISNPELGADIINQLMIEYEKMTIEDKKEMARLTLEFIDERLGFLGRELDSIKRMQLIFEQQNNLIDIESQSDLYFQIIGETDRMLMEQNVKENIASMLQQYLTDKKYNYDMVPSSLGLDDVTLNSLVIEYNKLQQQRKDYLDSKVPEGNIVVKKLTEQVEKVRSDLIENIRNIRASHNMQIGELRRKNVSVQSQLSSLPAKTKEWLDIKAQTDIKQELYKLLSENREETAISQASTIGNSKIIASSVPQKAPIKPNRRGIQIIAILIGLGIPAIVIFLMEVLNDKINTRFDIEKMTQAAVIGEIGHSYSDTSLVVSKTNRGMVAEQFRIIRSNLQYILNKVDKPAILVTSSFSGEGKSFVSVNLAAVMALAGKKTVVLEFDIRKPKILSGLQLPKVAGITNFILGKAEIQDLPKQVPGYENLYVLACGPVPPNPSEMLLDTKVDELFAYLKQNFDIILIDTAPVGMVSDAMTLSKYADCTLYIVRQGYTYKKQVVLIDEFYRNNKLPRINLMINDVKIKPGYGYYGYGRYGYGKGYGYGYYEEEVPKKGFMSRYFKWLNMNGNGKKVRRSENTNV